MRIGDRQYLHAGSVGGPNAGDRVLDDQTVFGSQTDVSPGGSAVERGQGMEKPFRVRLPASDILRTGDMLELLPDAGLFQNELDLVAKRSEIEFILEQAGIRKEFEHITSSENVARGKPDPEGFLHALASLNRRSSGGHVGLTAEDCLVIEDSIPGIRAAHAAGMKVLAVANTHTAQDLHEAEAVTKSLEEINLAELESRLYGTGEYD